MDVIANAEPSRVEIAPSETSDGGPSGHFVNLHDAASSPETEYSNPPIYTIDLSLPPGQRYMRVALDHADSLRKVPQVLDDLLEYIELPKRPIYWLARKLLRRLHSKEQTEELRGISKAVGLPLWLFVIFNVLLDLLMGCTSGGALVQPSDGQDPRMMHFRTLDWGMPELRDIIVHFEFVERPGGEVIARSIGYAGFVGILTGVREGLSVSLNVRPSFNKKHSLISKIKLRARQVGVVLGFCPSMATVLRDFLLPRSKLRTNFRKASTSTKAQMVYEHIQQLESQPLYGPSDVTSTLPRIPSSSYYLTFCTGEETFVLEKDRKTANIMRSKDFIVAANHDTRFDTLFNDEGKDNVESKERMQGKYFNTGTSLEDIVASTVDRKRCLVDYWDTWVKAHADDGANGGGDGGDGVPLDELKQWVTDYQICHDFTHFVCVMDPANGTTGWVRRFREGEIRMDDKDDDDGTDV